MSSKIPGDRDSLVALESLLRIGATGQREAKDTNGKSDNFLGQHRYTAPPKSSSVPATISPAIGNILPPSLGAAAGLLLRHHHSPPPQGFSHSQLAVAQRALAAAATFRQITAAGQSSSSSSPDNNQSSASSSGSNNRLVVEKLDIRKDKVEAALRSKPQRGKKRDDLSDKERLELTRSRNREHAKTTRIRKKARYQELLDCESRLKQVVATEELKIQRSLVLSKFLKLREHMVHATASNDTINNDGSSQFEDLVVTDKTLDPFKMHIVTSTTDETADGCESCISKMMAWDKDLASKIAQTYGDSAEKLLVYELVGGTDDIAITNNGVAHAKVNVLIQFNDGTKQLLLSGFLTASFENNAHRLASVEWTIIQDHCQRLAPRPSTPTRELTSSTSTARTSAPSDQYSVLLTKQSVYPSVVSLDPQFGGGSQEGTPARSTTAKSSRSSTPTREGLSF